LKPVTSVLMYIGQWLYRRVLRSQRSKFTFMTFWQFGSW